MIDICQKFHTNNLACLRGCYDQLRQILRTGPAVLIKIHIFCQDLKGHHLQFLEEMSLYYGEAGMQFERFREDCYDSSNLYLYGTGNYLTTEQKLSRVSMRMRDGQSNLLICLWFL